MNIQAILIALSEIFLKKKQVKRHEVGRKMDVVQEAEEGRVRENML